MKTTGNAKYLAGFKSGTYNAVIQPMEVWAGSDGGGDDDLWWHGVRVTDATRLDVFAIEDPMVCDIFRLADPDIPLMRGATRNPKDRFS